MFRSQETTSTNTLQPPNITTPIEPTQQKHQQFPFLINKIEITTTSFDITPTHSPPPLHHIPDPSDFDPTLLLKPLLVSQS